METAVCCFPLTALFTQKNQAALRQRIQKNQTAQTTQHSNRGAWETWAKPAAGQGERVRSALPCV